MLKIFLKLINISSSLNREKHGRDLVLWFCFSVFSFILVLIEEIQQKPKTLKFVRNTSLPVECSTLSSLSGNGVKHNHSLVLHSKQNRSSKSSVQCWYNKHLIPGWLDNLCFACYYILSLFSLSFPNRNWLIKVRLPLRCFFLRLQIAVSRRTNWLVHFPNQLSYPNETHRRTWLHLQRIPCDRCSRMILWCLCSSHQHDSYLYWWRIRRYLKGIIPHFDKVAFIAFDGNSFYLIRRHLFIYNNA